MRLLPPVAATAALLIAAPAVAGAAGGPPSPVQGGAGATAPGSALTYVAVGAPGGTLVEAIRRDGGAVERTRLVRGSFGVAGAAYDGSTTGLSADGRTLVLAAQRRRTTGLLVLDARRLRERRRFALPGFWAVDAISPDGGRLYFIHATSTDLTHYEVRAYDLRARRLDPEPVVDAHEPDERMQGLAMTRTVSADGRWAYTLYDRGRAAPFVHALDTAGRTARCIDVPQLTGQDLSRVRLGLTHRGRTLELRDDAFTRALVDTRSFAVREPGPIAAAPAARAATAPADEGGGVPWAPIALAAAALGAVALIARRRRRPRQVVT